MTVSTADDQAVINPLNPREAGLWELVQATHKLRQLNREVGTIFEEVQRHVWDGRDHLLGIHVLDASLQLLDAAVIRLANLAERNPAHATEVRTIRELVRDAAGPLRALQ